MDCSSRKAGACARIAACLLAATAILPMTAQARPDVSVNAASQEDLIAVAGRTGALALHQQLEVGSLDVMQRAGPLRYGVAMQYGTVIAPNPNDYLGQETDRRSLRLDREIFAGGTASLDVYKSWRMLASGGRVQLRMHDGLGDMMRRRTLNEGTLMGWRMIAGVQHPMGQGFVTLGWRMTRYAGRQRDPGQPTRGAAGHVGLEITSPL